MDVPESKMGKMTPIKRVLVELKVSGARASGR